jgi:hypothetical protein
MGTSYVDDLDDATLHLVGDLNRRRSTARFDLPDVCHPLILAPASVPNIHFYRLKLGFFPSSEKLRSTLQSLWDAVLLDGACYYSCVIRAASRIEVVNLNSNVPDPWQAIAEHYQQVFQIGLLLAMQQPAAKVPDKLWKPRVWNDDWHNF